MRTTVEFDEDTARAVDQLRRESGMGVSDAVNELIRRGLLPRQRSDRFTQRTHPVGIKIDVSNVAEVLEVLEGVDRR
ncbi:MAG: ribbon-helix-helix protein, CopG family [Acidimicrobiia bacterium]|nr:ribbon-helix-helix protein, CopG family [Acidimicrobiia bacterium]